jgi:hypothetical protein
MEMKQTIERIAKLNENNMGPTEENVKQKFIVPILELLGHKREDLEFEYRTLSTTTLNGRITHTGLPSEYSGKARKVTLQELVDARLVRNGQTLYFFHGRLFKDEQAEIVANQNKLKYKGELYSISEIAKIIDIKLGLKHDEHGVAGPIYWQTDDGRLLHDLNEIVRQQQK